MSFRKLAGVAVVGVLGLCGQLLAEAECSGWGEMRGIRIDGDLVPFTTTICAAGPGWQSVGRTGHWRTRNSTYAHDDGRITSTGSIGSGIQRGQGLTFKQIITDSGPDACILQIEATAESDMNLDGIYVFVSVPGAEYAQGSGELLGAAAPADRKVSFAERRPANDKHYVGDMAAGARLVSATRNVAITLDQPRQITIEDNRGSGDGDLSVFFPIGTGNLKKGDTLKASCTIRASGTPDKSPATITINPAQRGRPFAGIGGNFVYSTNSPTVDYYLDNLNVRWARVGMPLNRWQPQLTDDPTTRPAESLNGEIREAFRIAAELHRRNIPMIISVWNGPAWAYQPRAGGPGGGRGGRIAPDKWDGLAKAIGTYLLKFKEVAGAEPELFSFNEPNIGINVLQSPEEHRDGIKRLGAHFASIGLKTRLLLGDTGDSHAVNFVKATLADPEAMKYVGGISYHSWNSRSAADLTSWGKYATDANLPLFVAEAGTDSDGYRYPAVFAEPWYALDEAAMYQQCLSLSQPTAMLHWELTPDFGFVKPGKTPQDPVQTSMRWWQFKQLQKLTPAGAAVIGSSSNQAQITVSALAADDSAVSVIHLVNAGGARSITITGLPSGLKQMSGTVTDAKRNMQTLAAVGVATGTLQMTLPAQSFVTLTSSSR